jgi:Spy/CpxP family protein refolding chaperone
MRPFGWRIALYFTLVFAAGGGVGALTTYEYVVHHAQPNGAESFRRHAIAEMTKRLALTPDQVKQIDAIFDTTRDEFGAFRESHKAETRAILDRQTARIEAVLTPAQVAGFRKLRAEHEHGHDKQSK